MKTVLSFIFIFLISFSTIGQVDAYSEDVKVCIKQNGTYDYYADVVDQMFTMLKQQYSAKNVPDTVWNELEASKSDSMDELSQMLVSAYRGYFSHDDVKNMNALYKSQAGQTMVNDAHNLSASDKSELGQFYESDTGQKILGSQEEMNKLMSKISEMWSSDMYRSAVAKLSEKGFTLQQ
ncbi:MAG: DUF2059 domain-containing protein [Bacteroidia bacterium]|nr:DUF2059 domain-containing protein [Bacteroidia bacterium]NND11715.1 DUF2059 domain-containing protein [Flavobacteriaceae bacterium]NNK27237.1 DUF2059 domain-containing protein [Flavobacteriaceae bacterium]